ncbi:MAG TPA: hypothetical protein VE344_06995 [Methylomirabilota bacterium]|nr:hypothetical protein [Methylomirabilota bacterium]
MENNPVPLEEFIQGAITQIIRAISKSREEVKNLGGEINPRPYGENKELAAAGIARAVGGGSMSYIEFDIAVTATRGQSRESGIGVLLAAVGAGVKEKNERGNETVSRISFRVPVNFP